MIDSALECEMDPQALAWEQEKRLVLAAQRDSEAAGRLFDRYYTRIFGYVYRLTFDHALAEDLTSQVFMAAFKHLGRFRWKRVPFEAWLYRIATNEVRMSFRKQARVKMSSLESLDIQMQNRLSACQDTASETLVAQEHHRLLRRALLQLKSKYRTVIILRYFEDKALSEISAITGTREGTVKSQLHRGLAHLQEILIRDGVLP